MTGAIPQAVPNRDLLTVDGTPVAQSFDDANRPSDNGYAFDADGRMTDRPGGAGYLEWDSLGRLVRVRASEGGAVVATYTYDALDRLRTVERAGSRIRFRYAGTTAAVTGVVDDVGGTVLRQVVSGPDGMVLADRTGAGSDPRTYGTNGHHDVTWLADANGAVTATLRSDPWGTVVRSSGTLPDWRFQGSWSDTSTGLGSAPVSDRNGGPRSRRPRGFHGGGYDPARTDVRCCGRRSCCRPAGISPFRLALDSRRGARRPCDRRAGAVRRAQRIRGEPPGG